MGFDIKAALDQIVAFGPRGTDESGRPAAGRRLPPPGCDRSAHPPGCAMTMTPGHDEQITQHLPVLPAARS